MYYIGIINDSYIESTGEFGKGDYIGKIISAIIEINLYEGDLIYLSQEKKNEIISALEFKLNSLIEDTKKNNLDSHLSKIRFYEYEVKILGEKYFISRSGNQKYIPDLDYFINCFRLILDKGNIDKFHYFQVEGLPSSSTEKIIYSLLERELEATDLELEILRKLQERKLIDTNLNLTQKMYFLFGKRNEWYDKKMN